MHARKLVEPGATRAVQAALAAHVSPRSTQFDQASCTAASPNAPQAHEEVLRLLLAAAPRLDAMQLSNYLTRTLNNSKCVRGGRAAL